MNGAGGVTGATERRRTAMPNWCHNSMEIAGPVDEITRFKQACLRVVYTGEPAQLDFSAIKPMPNIFDGDPAEANDWGWARFDWVCKHWGTFATPSISTPPATNPAIMSATSIPHGLRQSPSGESWVRCRHSNFP
jgi:hypothetical protein